MGVDGSVDISVEQRHTILSLLRRHLPNTTVWVYGSRAKWTARPQSDLDMVVLTPLEQARQVSSLREALEQSSLPFRVDLFIWDEVPKSFQREIEAEHVVLAEATIKQAENDWRYSHWGDIATLEYGRALKAYRSTEGPFRVFGTNGPIGWHEEALCNHASVIVGRKGAYRGIHYSSAPFFVIDTAFYLEPKEEIDMRWAYYALLTQDIDRMDSGSAIPSTSREDFYRLSVSVPPLREQRAIARILGTLDDKIELNRRMNETLEAIARTLFKDWFVDFGPVRAKMEGRDPGLPRRIADRFPDMVVKSQIGEVPAGWDTKPLDDIAQFLNGLALQKFPASNPSDSLPVIKIAELRNGVTAKTNRASREVPEKYVVKDGDFLFSWSGSLLAKFWTEGEGALNQHLFKVSSIQYPKWFFSHWVCHHLEEFRAIAASKATTMGHIQRSHLKEAITICPPDNVLNVLDPTISSLVDRTIQNDLESRTLAQTRDLLLPKLISGEIRLRDAEKLVESVA